MRFIESLSNHAHINRVMKQQYGLPLALVFLLVQVALLDLDYHVAQHLLCSHGDHVDLDCLANPNENSPYTNIKQKLC